MALKTRRSTFVFAATLVIALLASVGGAHANAKIDVSKCLQLTTRTGLNTDAILTGLVLTLDQKKALRARLASYWGVRGFAGLEGLGLTPEQIKEIQRRIDLQVARMNKYPLGWPCAPFKNQARAVKYVKAKLIYNGFRPAMTITIPSTRQIQFVAIQDGQRFYGTVAKSGPRQIKIGLACARPCSGGTYTFNLSFDA